MEYRVSLTPRAVSDIEEAFVYIEREAPAHARRWLVGLMDLVNSLEEMPERFSIIPESERFDREMRQALYGRRTGVYRIVFRIYHDDHVVRVLCVRHGARDRLNPDDLDG